MTEEQKRLEEARRKVKDWKQWGPYLSERAWGTVREDYSEDGNAWEFFPHDHARSRVFRWNEDGVLGICDRRQQICFALALWNGADPILKERMFGLTNGQGNHGEDVKDYYYFLDSTPTHSYMKALYKYPQAPFPYQQLIDENKRRGKLDPEYELCDTGVFNENRYFDVFVEYYKAEPDDILIEITVINRGPDTAPITVLPTLWFRNTWSWTADHPRPRITAQTDDDTPALVADHAEIGLRYLNCFPCGDAGSPELVFTENETNFAKLYPPDGRNVTSTVKDGINDYIVDGVKGAIHPDHTGTKAAAVYRLSIAGGQTQKIRLRLAGRKCRTSDFESDFDSVAESRRSEADEFYATVVEASASADEKAIQRQAFAGMLWSKQFYHFNVRKWLDGDPTQPTPPPARRGGRNCHWDHVDSADVISMPDTWEYPWFAAWDLSFHSVTLSLVDPNFAKDQLILLQREWYMQPNGQLPAYEWAFGDVNPPVQAWSAMRVYQIDRRLSGKGDVPFLQRVFHKLLLNFTWWVNRKDTEGRNVFQGGFLGLDNIGVFDRSAPLPTGGFINQSDGTAWMAMYCLNMFAIAIELSGHDTAYQDVAVKFLEHFFYIANAMNDRPGARGDDGLDLWDNQDCFYYDVLHLADNTHFPLRLRSAVGLLPLLAVQTIEQDQLERVPELRKRIDWFIANRPDLCSDIASITNEGAESRRLFSIVNKERLQQILRRMLDPREFLSPHGIRALSRYHLDHPYSLTVHGVTYEVKYDPAQSTTGAFGGNSNWRGPIWFPLNYLLIELLQRLDYYYGDEMKVECPVGSGNMMTLWDVSLYISHSLTSIFERGEDGNRPVFGSNELFQKDANFRDYLPFAEYFHGDTGAGLGATHQTGWTGLIAKIIQQRAEYASRPVDRSPI